jgi:hypothetical protein
MLLIKGNVNVYNPIPNLDEIALINDAFKDLITNPNYFRLKEFEG